MLQYNSPFLCEQPTCYNSPFLCEQPTAVVELADIIIDARGPILQALKKWLEERKNQALPTTKSSKHQGYARFNRQTVF
jgi:hypothetical protein